MKLKEGVTIQGISNEMLFALQAIAPIIETYGVQFVITSCTDGEHSAKSLHYHGRAIDIRTRDFDPADIAVVALSMRRALGAEFDVVVESTHIHVEFDPKR